jgi:hypothetical protein
MKRSEIEIGPNTLLLGIFSTETFHYFYTTDCENYRNLVPRYPKATSVIDIVKCGAIDADKIIFILDDIHFPIDIDKSITCHELYLICSDEKLFNKTIFVKGENVIDFDKNIVL